MTAIERLAQFVSGLNAIDVPRSALDSIRLHLADTLGACSIGGAGRDGSAIADLVRETGGPGPVPAVGLHLRTSSPLAALAMCAATRCTEIDDIHMASCTTPGSVVVPTALAAAWGQPHVTEDDFLSALLVGYEVLTRFGQAVDGPNIVYRGIWPTRLGGGLAASAVTARLLRLSSEQAAEALTLALASCTGPSLPAGGPGMRWLSLGLAAETGVWAALAARRGLGAGRIPGDDDWRRLAGVDVDLEALLRDLGESFAIGRTSIKPYCAAKQATSAIQGFLEIRDAHRLQPSEIDRVTVAVPPQYAGMIGRSVHPSDRQATITSVRYQLALAAFHPEQLRDVLRPTIHPQDAFGAFMEKVTVRSDENLGRHFPACWPARVEVRTGGKRYEREILQTPGDPEDPFDWAAEELKLRAIANGALDGRLIDLCKGLGRGTGLSALLAAATEGV